MSADISTIVTRLESVTTRLEGLAAAGGVSGGGSAVELSEYVAKFEEQVMQEKFKQYMELSNKIGGEVAEQAAFVNEAFNEMKEILVLASKHKTPSQNVFEAVCKGCNLKVNAVISYCETRRSSKVFNNLMTVKEGIGCVGWVTVAPKPAPYLKECGDQAQFYGNRVIKEHKGKNADHVSWVGAYTGTIRDLQEYVKAYHTTGLVWNKAGSPLNPSSGPPPPPPPAIQPPEETGVKSGSEAAQAAQRANLFASINKGGAVTQGLRKVTDDMKTHKTPELRASSVVKASESKPASKPAPTYGSATAKKSPVLALQGKKWVVEFQEDQSNLSIANTNAKQSVYVYKCTKSTLKVSGKVNSIIIDSCKRMGLVFQDVISSAEVINSQGVQVQVLGKCPTISIDKTDGCQVYLSEDSIKCEIVSAKSSEMNVSIPPKGGSGDFSEHPIPEQFKTTWNGSALVTKCTDI